MSFLGMHVPHGDPLLVHLMMLHKVRSQQIFEMGRFLFEIQGMHLDFGETIYILICGLRVGPYVDLLHDEKGRSNSNLCARLFPDFSNAHVVMLIQLVFMLKGLHGRDIKTSILAVVYKLVDNIDDLNGFAWGTYFRTCTSGLMCGMFEKIENFIIFKLANPESKKIHKYIVAGFIIPFKPNNQPIYVVANLTELMFPFYLCNVNWTLKHQESPPRQHSLVPHSPLVVVSPPRRKKYKLETSSTESSTNASFSQATSA
uniref:Uncharacterized protein n=1 Tax=Lactuca sativa TaxID=4236 RepID=A0A9R1UTS6_LACSA|nr:hypothetical protein LSAT_V11C800398020 [Lactuca sativa]